MIFTLSPKEVEKVIDWKANHPCKFVNVTTAIGGKHTYEFTPTGLGTITIVRCSCGSSLNLTEYEGW